MRLSTSLIVAVTVVVALSACASDGAPSRYAQDRQKLESDCSARGGILTPTGATTGSPESEYACTIRGGATRLD